MKGGEPRTVLLGGEAGQSRYAEAARTSTEAVAVARAVEAPTDEAFALVTIGLSIAFLGRTAEGVATMRAAEELAGRSAT